MVTFVIYHIVHASAELGDPYAPPSLADEGFVHCSYAGAVRESAALHFPAGAPLEVLTIDPSGLSIEIADTPRGEMPHVRQSIPARHITARVPLEVFGFDTALVDRAMSHAMDHDQTPLAGVSPELQEFCARAWDQFAMAVYGATDPADPNNPRAKDEYERLKRDYSFVSEGQFSAMWGRAFRYSMM